MQVLRRHSLETERVTVANFLGFKLYDRVSRACERAVQLEGLGFRVRKG